MAAVANGKMRTSLQRPPVTEVHRFNVHAMAASIRAMVMRAQFIALDTEFTGLGDPKKTKVKDMEERYGNLKTLVETHAVVSFGLAIFAPRSQPAALHACREYKVFNFNLTLLKETEFTANPQSLMFLVDTGFDFNYQLRMGIPYAAGASHGKSDEALLLRQIFRAILSSQRPVVFHNSLLDLMFVYNSFYGPLPSNLETFMADVAEMFPGKLFDTKYVADFHTREDASFLSYLFRKYERQDRSSDRGLVVDVAPEIVMPSGSFGFVTSGGSRSAVCGNRSYCVFYARHGFCRRGRECRKSHDLDVILDDEDRRAALKRGKKRKSNDNEEDDKEEENEDGREEEDNNEESEPVAVSILPPSALPEAMAKPDAYHAAGYDAFMTGYVFAHQLACTANAADVDQFSNRLYIMSKSFPLLVRKSVFANTSPFHRTQKSLNEGVHVQQS